MERLRLGDMFHVVLRKQIRSRTLDGKQGCGRREGPFEVEDVNFRLVSTVCGRVFKFEEWTVVRIDEPELE